MAPAGVPLTPGRDLGGASPWNAWIDFTQTRIDDDRGPLDTEATDNYLAVGIDYLFRPGLVVGVQLEADRTETEDASGLIEGSSQTAGIGAYFAAKTSPNWVVSGLLSFGQTETDLRVASLEGDYTRNRARASLTASGQYAYRNLLIRPSATLDYIRFSGADYTLSGPVLGAPQTILAEVPEASYATFTPELELSRPFMAGDDVVMPYVRLGLSYELDTGDCSLPGASTDDRLSGQTRVGTRMRLGGALFADASLGYLSAFQDDLDVVEGRIYLSMSF
jgi:outer membrane autotransporter protein